MSALSTESSTATDESVNDPVEVLEQLSASTDASPYAWRDHIFEALGQWRLPREEIDGEEHVYFIAGEAFNWRRLAERLAWHIGLQLPEDEEERMRLWIEDDHMFGGLEELAFRRVLGHDKWRAFLNYFYGVTLERCLVVHAGSRIAKASFTKGRRANDDLLDEAYDALYGESEGELWQRFLGESDLTVNSAASRTLAQDDEFTYWLFKRRIGTTYQTHIAHEVKHGLDALERIAEADRRRRRMMTFDGGGELLEFKLTKRVVNGRRRNRAGGNGVAR